MPNPSNPELEPLPPFGFVRMVEGEAYPEDLTQLRWLFHGGRSWVIFDRGLEGASLRSERAWHGPGASTNRRPFARRETLAEYTARTGEAITYPVPEGYWPIAPVTERIPPGSRWLRGDGSFSASGVYESFSCERAIIDPCVAPIGAIRLRPEERAPSERVVTVSPEHRRGRTPAPRPAVGNRPIVTSRPPSGVRRAKVEPLKLP